VRTPIFRSPLFSSCFGRGCLFPPVGPPRGSGPDPLYFFRHFDCFRTPAPPRSVDFSSLDCFPHFYLSSPLPQSTPGFKQLRSQSDPSHWGWQKCESMSPFRVGFPSFHSEQKFNPLCRWAKGYLFRQLPLFPLPFSPFPPVFNGPTLKGGALIILYRDYPPPPPLAPLPCGSHLPLPAG